MSNYDDLLQQHIQALQEGRPVDEILSSLRPDEQHLAELIRLAAAIHTVPHPSPQSSHLAEILSAAQSTPIRKERILSRNTAAQMIGGLFNAKGARTWQAPAALAGAALLVIFTCVAILTFTFMGSRQYSNTAMLTNIEGVIEVASLDNSTRWSPGKNGQHLASGTLIRSGQGSSATLSYPDGSSMAIGPGTQLTLTHLSGGRNKPLQAIVLLDSGQTQHQVVPFTDKRATYMVYTPSGAISVHGTRFGVQVDQAGRSRVAVDTGKVLFTNSNSQLFLLPGQVTNAGIDDEVLSPSYQFSLQGKISNQLPNVWYIEGVPVSLVETTVIEGVIGTGAQVLVLGQVLESGEFVADSIAPTSDPAAVQWFNGVLEANHSSPWVISGWELVVEENTTRDADLAVGEAVRVSFTLMEDGRWLATQIERIAAEPEPTPSPDPEAVPELVFYPDELQDYGCSTSTTGRYEFTGTLYNDGQDPKDFAAGVELDYQVVKGAEYVDLVELVPASFERIEAGDSVDFQIQVTLNTDWASAPLGGEIKVRVFVANEINRPDDHRTRVTATLINLCAATPTNTVTPSATTTTTPTVTPSPTITATQEVTATVVPTDTLSIPNAETTFCVGAQPHPTGQRLAEENGVTYEYIMGWFCQGLGFGEIELAFQLEKQNPQYTADQILTMRLNGMSWGELKALVGPKPTKTPKPEKTEKPPKPEKDK